MCVCVCVMLVGCFRFIAYNVYRVFNAKSIFIEILSSISNNSLAWLHILTLKKHLFQAIQFSQAVLILTIHLIWV